MVANVATESQQSNDVIHKIAAHQPKSGGHTRCADGVTRPGEI